MILDYILQYPFKSLLYMERLVNDGSPSLFSFKYTTSRETCPLYTSQFKICAMNDPSPDEIEDVGVLPAEFNVELNNVFFLHPDWRNVSVDFQIDTLDLYVSPTSSSRTVRALWSDYYIKLCYPGILGRITRELRKEHILSSIDVTRVLSDLIKRNNCPEKLSFFPEWGGRLYHHEFFDMGFVIRAASPYGNTAQKVKAIIPAFSLFSIDKESNDLPIIVQMLNRQSKPIDYILEQLIYPIIDIFFYCLLQGGLLLEMHSQNFLVGIDNNADIITIILRDLESVDKDMTIIDDLNLEIKLQSYPYKCICSEQYNYLIKHSFMYDHKLGEYFLDQLINCLVKYRLTKLGKIENLISVYVKRNYGHFLDLFPNGVWYKFSNVLIDRSSERRPYISYQNPKYR